MRIAQKDEPESATRTGKGYRSIHAWLDKESDKKAERHDITRIYEFGKLIEAQQGKEGLQEYIRHLHDDIKTKFHHLRQDLAKSLAETLAYFGVIEEILR